MSIKTFEDLTVWQKAHMLTLDVYKITKSFPKEEKYSLTQQLRRSSSSVPTNIVEGYRRKSTNDLLNFLNIALGSLEETKYQLILSKDLDYITANQYNELREKANEISKMLFGLKRSLTK